jgi:hypothetical protein
MRKDQLANPNKPTETLDIGDLLPSAEGRATFFVEVPIETGPQCRGDASGIAGAKIVVVIPQQPSETSALPTRPFQFLEGPCPTTVLILQGVLVFVGVYRRCRTLKQVTQHKKVVRLKVPE